MGCSPRCLYSIDLRVPPSQYFDPGLAIPGYGIRGWSYSEPESVPRYS